MDEAAAGAPIHAAHSVRRWALRSGAVLSLAAGAWFLGCSTAAAETPDASSPGSSGGLLAAVHESTLDNTVDVADLSSSGLRAGERDDADAGAAPSAPAATEPGEDTVVLSAVTRARSAPDAESAAPVGDLVMHRTTSTAPPDPADAPPAAADHDEVTTTILDAAAGNAAGASVARLIGIGSASDSPVAAATSDVRPVLESAHVLNLESADLLNLPTAPLIAPVTEAIRPLLGAVDAKPAPVTDIVMSAANTLDGALSGREGPAGDSVAGPALSGLPSPDDILRGKSGGADAVPLPMLTRHSTAAAGAHRIVGMHASGEQVSPVAAVRPAAEREVDVSSASPQPDQPMRLPAGPVATVAGVGSAPNGGFDCAAWADASGTSRPDRTVSVRASDRSAVLDRACDLGFSPD